AVEIPFDLEDVEQRLPHQLGCGTRALLRHTQLRAASLTRNDPVHAPIVAHPSRSATVAFDADDTRADAHGVESSFAPKSHQPQCPREERCVSEPRLRRAEITREQTHVDRVYARLGELRDAAEEMRSKGYEISKGARSEAEIEQASMLFERDMMVSHANQTLQTLDAEYEGLVFGRLDYAPGDDTGHDRGHETDADRDHETEDPAGGSAEPVYVGRLGIRDEQFENLVTDWRAPAAAAFYQATPQEPRGVLRRRVIRCSGDRVLDVDDDVLLARSLPDELPVVGEGALMAALGR